jgi:hypothetical protein
MQSVEIGQFLKQRSRHDAMIATSPMVVAASQKTSHPSITFDPTGEMQ